MPKLRPSVQKVLDNALQGNETSNYELEFETKKKEIRYLLGKPRLSHYIFLCHDLLSNLILLIFNVLVQLTLLHVVTKKPTSSESLV